jgi:cob(I)alamin adenosyltransferase
LGDDYSSGPRKERLIVSRHIKVYTRTGDGGETGLGIPGRVPKTHPRIEALGAIDELNAALGMVLCQTLADELRPALLKIQNQLFSIGAEISTPDPAGASSRISESDAGQLEAWMDQWDESLPPLRNFILPGGTPAAAAIHFARTVCRRSERAVYNLHAIEPVPQAIRTYVNRLSDTLFVMARFDNHSAGVQDIVWDSSQD